MKYKTMKLLCFFDLPMQEKKDLREYRKFRNKLIEAGFVMMQFSVYVRTCPNRDFAMKIKKNTKKICPPSGNVRLLEVTEKQYNDIELIVGTKSLKEKLGTATGLIII